jgi:hypothetical protein
VAQRRILNVETSWYVRRIGKTGLRVNGHYRISVQCQEILHAYNVLRCHINYLNPSGNPTQLQLVTQQDRKRPKFLTHRCMFAMFFSLGAKFAITFPRDGDGEVQG